MNHSPDPHTTGPAELAARSPGDADRAALEPTKVPASYQRHGRFVAFVHDLVLTPGARADLRSGLGKDLDRAARMHRYIASWTTQTGGQALERAHYTVAALIAATHKDHHLIPGPLPERVRTLGQCLGEAIDPAKGLSEASAEQHLHQLTRQSLRGLHRHLPSLARHLVTVAGPGSLDYPQLLADLAAWSDHRGRVTRRWLQDFYRARYRTPTVPPKA